MINYSRKRRVLPKNAQSRKRHPRARGWKCWRFGGESCGTKICGVFGGQQASRNQSGWHPTLAQTWSAVVGRSSAYMVRPKMTRDALQCSMGLLSLPTYLSHASKLVEERLGGNTRPRFGTWRQWVTHAESTTDSDLTAENTGILSILTILG